MITREARPMRLECETTLDDAVEANLRALARSRTERKTCWRGALWTGLLSALIVFLLPEASFSWKLVRSGLAFVLGALLALVLHRSFVSRRLRRYLREHMGDAPLKTTLELTDAGITHTDQHRTLSFQWSAVESITEDADAIEFIIQGGGLVLVHNRDFDSPDHRQRFLEYAREQLEAARQSPSY